VTIRNQRAFPVRFDIMQTPKEFANRVQMMFVDRQDLDEFETFVEGGDIEWADDAAAFLRIAGYEVQREARFRDPERTLVAGFNFIIKALPKRDR
jgi:hypothetical protein